MKKAASLVATMVAALMISGGAALAVNTIQCKANDLKANDLSKPCSGTRAADLMKGSAAGSDWMIGKGGGNTAGWEEILSGQGGNDRLHGGDGWDVLNGGPGSDTLVGDEDGRYYADTYEFEANDWGRDTITDTLTYADYADESWIRNSINFGSGITGNLYINLNASETRHEVTNGTSTVNWSGFDIINGANNSGTGYDTIIGNDDHNQIRSIGGVDTVLAGDGADNINVADGAGNDTVNCGAGTDSVAADAGDELTNRE